MVQTCRSEGLRAETACVRSGPDQSKPMPGEFGGVEIPSSQVAYHHGEAGMGLNNLQRELLNRMAR